MKGGLVIWILFQGKDQIGGFLCRAQYRRGKISEGSASGGDDGEIHADQDMGLDMIVPVMSRRLCMDPFIIRDSNSA